MIDLLKIKEDKNTSNASSRVDTLIALLLEKEGKEDEGFVESLLAKKGRAMSITSHNTEDYLTLL